MPFKSKAQRRLFWAKVRRGEISERTARRWERETRRKGSLPERLHGWVPPCRKGWRRGRAKDMDPTQLQRGIAVEKEHFKDARRACRTAVDHLMEHPDYYRRLRKARL